MPAMTSTPPPSALQVLLDRHRIEHSNANDSAAHLALQIAHNLRYQHNWSSLRLHRPGACVMLSGIPPQRLYIHPDEQMELLQQQKTAGKTGMPQLSLQREWVLPSRLREKWSLRRFGDAFDAIDAVPLPDDGEPLFETAEAPPQMPDTATSAAPVRDWQSTLPKRVLLATVDDDSTVVYYIVHDGIVKPRQN